MQTIKDILARIEAHLVDDWRRAWRWLSVWAMAVAGAMIEAWNAFPSTMQAVLPERWAHVVAVAVLILGIAGRVVKQRGGNGGAP